MSLSDINAGLSLNVTFLIVIGGERGFTLGVITVLTLLTKSDVNVPGSSFNINDGLLMSSEESGCFSGSFTLLTKSDI